jgi:hypothetical protein
MQGVFHHFPREGQRTVLVVDMLQPLSSSSISAPVKESLNKCRCTAACTWSADCKELLSLCKAQCHFECSKLKRIKSPTQHSVIISDAKQYIHSLALQSAHQGGSSQVITTVAPASPLSEKLQIDDYNSFHHSQQPTCQPLLYSPHLAAVSSKPCGVSYTPCLSRRSAVGTKPQSNSQTWYSEALSLSCGCMLWSVPERIVDQAD